MKFKYDYLNNRFWRIEGEYSYQISEENQFIDRYGGRGFVLDTNQPNHSIIFNVYDRIIRVFYEKLNRVHGKEEIIYYQKDIPREVIIEFELTEKDIVARRDDGGWAKK